MQTVWFEHSHTGERIAQRIAEIIKEFGITNKVTDNAANMVKAFNLLPDMCQDTADVQSDSGTSDSNVEILSITHLAQPQSVAEDREDDVNEEEADESEQSIVYLLLEHKRCANHTLNLVASADSFKARESIRYKRMYDGAMGKHYPMQCIVAQKTLTLWRISWNDIPESYLHAVELKLCGSTASCEGWHRQGAFLPGENWA